MPEPLRGEASSDLWTVCPKKVDELSVEAPGSQAGSQGRDVHRGLVRMAHIVQRARIGQGQPPTQLRDRHREEGNLKIRAAIVSVVAVLALLAPSAQASQVCYDVQVNAQGQSVVSQTGCQDLPL